jgi:hypothetical protein
LACGPRLQVCRGRTPCGGGAGLGRVWLGHGEAEGMTVGTQLSASAARATTGKRAGGLAGPADGPLCARLLHGLSCCGLLLLLLCRDGLLRGWRCWAAGLDGVG